jgi:hypothetical protein
MLGEPNGKLGFGQIAGCKGEEFGVAFFVGCGHVETVEEEEGSADDVGGAFVAVEEGVIAGDAAWSWPVWQQGLQFIRV